DGRGDRRGARRGDPRAIFRQRRRRAAGDRAHAGRVDRQGGSRGPRRAEGVPEPRREEARGEGRDLEGVLRRGDEERAAVSERAGRGGGRDAGESREAPLDSARPRAATGPVLAEPLYWFPVRHHSPNVARHLRAALLARRPKVVFLEAPASAQSLIPHLVDAKTKPPVAIYVSYRDDANRFGWAGVTKIGRASCRERG